MSTENKKFAFVVIVGFLLYSLVAALVAVSAPQLSPPLPQRLLEAPSVPPAAWNPVSYVLSIEAQATTPHKVHTLHKRHHARYAVTVTIDPPQDQQDQQDRYTPWWSMMLFGHEVYSI